MSKKASDTTCPRCEGSGQCAECKGAGHVTCLTCDGKGGGKTPRGLDYECKTCGGTGQMSCDPKCASCEGTGVITAALQQKIYDKYTVRFSNMTPLSKITQVLFGLNLVMFIAQQVPGVESALVNKPDSLAHFELWRFVAPIFMHVGLMHLAVNSYFLLKYCPQLEGAYGSRKFLALYLFSGLAGTIVNWCFADVTGIGASGALFGVAAAYVALHYRWGFLRREEITPWGLYLLGYMLLGFTSQLSGNGLPIIGHVDNWGHLGGFIGGFAFAWLTKRPMGR